MVLLSLILILLVGGIASSIVARRSVTAARWMALASVSVDFAATIGVWIASAGRSTSRSGLWFEECNFDWIPQFGIPFHLGIDGLSLALLHLTYFLGIMAILCSWTEIRERAGFFHFNALCVLPALTGLSLPLHLLAFYPFSP